MPSFASIPHLDLIISVTWAAYIVAMGGWVLLEKRDPAATLSWLISLALLPLVGFAVYYFIGPRRVARQRLRRVRAKGALPPGAQTTSEQLLEHARLAKATTDITPSTATRVDLLVDGAATYDALLAAIAEARDHVHLEYYIFLPDKIGTAIRDALIERARAGVKVRLLLDAVGSRAVKKSFLRPLLEASGEAVFFHPPHFPVLWRRPMVNLRTHRKIVIVDGDVAFTGGINITDEQDERVCPGAYRDLHMRLEGDVVHCLELAFLEDWVYATGSATPTSPTPTIPTPKAKPGPIGAHVLMSGPDSRWEPIHRVQVAAIHGAERRVWLTTPYFVPGEAALMSLTSAALAGLDVRLLVPKRSDSLVVTLAARSYFDELLQAGVHIYEYGPRMLHTKALLCDDDLTILGSANFDHRSFRLNFELSVMFFDAELAARVATLIEAECATTEPLPVVRSRSLKTRLPEAVARLWSPLL